MELADLVRVSSPLDRPWHFTLLELAVLAAALLVFGHALARWRAGDRRHLFQWLVITSYGVQMELIAFHFLDNYEHARFTVQLYGGQLPLYITGLYGVFLYTGVKVAERMRVRPIAEPFLAGFAICLIDVPFDVAGVALGWWTWADTDPVLAHRWLGVPVTSYAWYLIFGAVAAALCRALWPRVERRGLALAAIVALPAGALVIVLGVIGFLPFHALHALGLSHGAIVAGHLAACALLAIALRGAPEALPRSLALAALAIPGAALVAMMVASSGDLADAPLRIASSIAAVCGLAALATVLPARRRAPAPAIAAAPAE